ncbi:hypothetical protein ACWEVP_44740 [Amycolatopsis sp. NPDC003865]
MLTGIAHAALSVGAVNDRDFETWTADQVERVRSGRLFVALPLFIAAAGKPSGEAH